MGDFLIIPASIAMLAQRQPLRWANVGSPTLGQRGFVSWPNGGTPTLVQHRPNVGTLTLGQRWQNVTPMVVCQCCTNIGPTEAALLAFCEGTHRSPIGHRLNKQSSWVTSDLRHQCNRRQCNIHMSKDVTVLFWRCTDWSKHNVQKDNGLLLAGAKPLIWTNAGIYCQLDPCKQTSVKFNRNSYICIQENAFENVVCKNCDNFVWASMS